MRFACGLIALLLPAAAHADEPKHRELLEAFQKQLAAVAFEAGPSIACVVVSRSELYPAVKNDAPGRLGAFDPKEFLKANETPERVRLARSLDLSNPTAIPDHGYAGGVVIDSAGLILTPYHVVAGATKVYVFLSGGAGSYADIHAADARCDLAVLKLITPPPPEKLKPIRFGDVRTPQQNPTSATVTAGKLVVLVANPYSSSFRFEKPSAAFGAITNVRRKLVPLDPKKSATTSEKLASHYLCGTLLEHDVKVNGPVSGGALLDLDGKLVGLATAAAVVFDRELGPGYAIPADDNFRRLVGVLRRGEEIEYGFLGVQLPSDTATPPRLQEVTDNGPAEAAGLRPNDLVIEINGNTIASFDDLMLHIGSALAGSTVKLKIVRFGEKRDIDVTLGKFRNDQPFIASFKPEPVFGIRVDYSTTRTVPIGNPRMFRPGPQGIPTGVWIREVVPDSPAAAKFKALGDRPDQWLVVKVNGTSVSTPGEFYRAAKGQEKATLMLRDPNDPGRERELILP
jgi:serine protease Do